LNNKAIGTAWETVARTYLEECGYKILCCNYRCKIGEIDIIAQDKETIVFIEVKFRKSKCYGSALEAVNYKKQQTIRQVATYYLMKTYHTEYLPCRFDVLGFDKGTITHIKDAF